WRCRRGDAKFTHIPLKRSLLRAVISAQPCLLFYGPCVCVRVSVCDGDVLVSLSRPPWEQVLRAFLTSVKIIRLFRRGVWSWRCMCVCVCVCVGGGGGGWGGEGRGKRHRR